jgi:Tfp pilus assembly protein PilN
MAVRETNLIPPQVLYQQHLVRHVCFWSGCLVLSLALVFGIYVYQGRAITAKERALMNLKDQHKLLGTKIEEIRQIQQQLQNLTEEQGAMGHMTQNRPYSQVLQRLAEIMNEHTWLTQLAIEADKEVAGRANVKLAGFSHSNKDLGDFLNQLANEPMFQAVLLNFAKETKERHSKDKTAEPLTLVQFQIDCHV